MFSRMIRRLGHRRWFAAVGSRVLPRLDRATYRLSGRRWMLASIAFPTILLHCGGSKPVPLLHARHDGGFLVAATNWGRPQHPAWSTRLLSGCAAAVEMHRVVTPVAARSLTGEEMSAVWPLLLEVWPAFDTYRKRARREIRVFHLTPRAPTPT